MRIKAMLPARGKSILLAGAAGCALAVPALAEDVGKVFSLGEVSTSAPAPDGTSLGGSTVTRDDIRDFNRDTLDKALQLVPGTVISLQGNRNETNIWIRGFDRWRVPLYQDGVPIYLPVDNRIDFSRFTTADVSEIQVTKGFTSVIDGPGAVGGSVNIVSRQVGRPLEGDLRIGTSFDQDGAFNGFVADAFGGSRQDNWYLQGAVSENYRNHFRLSESFQPGGYENGGNRNNSYAQDYKINVKAGYVPNATDEYALNVVSQIGHKEDPPINALAPASSTKFWDWPAWDKQSIYWLSKTALDGAGSYVKTSLYYDRFYNALSQFDNATYSTQKNSSSFNSRYDDRAAGGGAEIKEVLFGGRDEIRASTHFRWDQHNETQWGYNSATNPIWYQQPWESDEENTYSVAAENTYHPAKDWDVVTGVSYDYRQMIGANQWSAGSGKNPYPYGVTVHYPVSDKHAVNANLAGIYHYDQTGSVHASLSDRTRFPTLFEMYSNRFGTATGNPYLQPERSIYWEAGVADTLAGTHLAANLYYARVMNAIVGVPVVVMVNGAATSVNQSQNAGTEIHKGFELELSRPVLPGLELGGNYSYLERQNVNHALAGPATMTPKHKLFLYADWKPLEGLSVVPNLEYDSKRYFQMAQNTVYMRSGDFILANLKLSYDILKNVQIEAGVRNLLDYNYATDYGFNAEGRSYFTNLRVSF